MNQQERDQADRQLELMRYRALERETTAPLATRLIHEIVSDLEVDLERSRRMPGPEGDPSGET